ncbi:MAG: metal-dependent transcriptional regulator [Ignavibacteriales bacterium]|nr:metal-dependent transcriptional regulator [Ignavibacteriales bacterium]
MPSAQVENYLKNIYKLQDLEGRVTTSVLSEKLQLSPPSVTEMIKKLADDGSVTYTPYKGVELTEEGRRKALRIIRRHRLWELFLVQVLRFEWDEIDEEAERLEHSTSERLEQRIDEILGYPDRDPHGDAIPTAEGLVSAPDHASLASVLPGSRVRVARVNDERAEVLQYMSKLGIGLGTEMTISERIDFDGSLRVDVGAKQEFISSKLAQYIFVEVLNIREKVPV